MEHYLRIIRSVRDAVAVAAADAVAALALTVAIADFVATAADVEAEHTAFVARDIHCVVCGVPSNSPSVVFLRCAHVIHIACHTATVCPRCRRNDKVSAPCPFVARAALAFAAAADAQAHRVRSANLVFRAIVHNLVTASTNNDPAANDTNDNAFSATNVLVLAVSLARNYIYQWRLAITAVRSSVRSSRLADILLALNHARSSWAKAYFCIAPSVLNVLAAYTGSQPFPDSCIADWTGDSVPLFQVHRQLLPACRT